MKIKISILLSLTLLLGTLLTCLALPAFADTVSQPHPEFIDYTFEDWDEHTMALNDKYTGIAGGVIGINGNPALSIIPLKQGNSFNWNHFGIPCVFANGTEYVVSYDITLLSNLTLDTPKEKTKWHADAFQSNMVGASGDTNGYLFEVPGVDFTVVSGAWTHVQGTLTVSSGEWRTLDTLYFWEEQVDGINENSQIAIDNLVVMEKEEFQKHYPNGVPARTDVPKVDMLANNFNTNRAVPVWCNDQTKNNFTTSLDGDGRAKWTWTSGTTAFTFFNFEAGKTYHLSFDAATEAASDVTLKAVATEGRTDMTNADAEAFTGESLTIKSKEWTHLDLTLTATKAHKFFAMALDASESTVVWVDNFALYVDGSTPSCDLTPRIDKFTSSNRLISNFSNDRNLMFSCNWYWATAEKITTLNDGNKVQEVNHYGAWSKAAGNMAFKKDTTYVVNFDIYGVKEGAQIGDVISSGLRFYSHNYNLSGDPNGTQFSYSDGKGGLIGDLSVKAGEWIHYTLEATVAKSNENYFVFFNCTGSPVTYYIDNLTIVVKTDCTGGHTEGVWVDDVIATCENEGHSILKCAVCGEKLQEKKIDKTHIPSEKLTVVEPKCNQEGSYEIKCIKCHEVLETGKLDKTAHQPGEWEETTVADCHHAGEKICKCTQCHEVVATQTVPQLTHIATKWITDVEPAAGVNGHKYKKCTVCGDVIDEQVLESMEPVSTEKPASSSAAPEEPEEETEGCFSVLGGGEALAITTLLCGAWTVLKKKKH